MITFDTYILDNQKKEYIKTLIEKKKLKILINGQTETGKTLLIDCIKESFLNDENYTIFKIEQFNDIGINYFRQDVKYFCKYNTTKQKVIIVDNIDYIKECSQHIIKSIIEKYPNIIYIFSCRNIKKVYEPIINTLFIIQLENLSKNETKKVIDIYCQQTNFHIKEDIKNYIIKMYYNKLPSTILNIIKTLKLLKKEHNNETVDLISSALNNSLFKKYFMLLKNDKLSDAINILVDVNMCFVSLIDLFEYLYEYVKEYINIQNEEEMEILKILAKYKLFINVSQEKNIEIYFLTYDIYNEIQKYKDSPKYEQLFKFD